MMDRACSRLNPSYQHHITFACTRLYQLDEITVLALLSLPQTNRRYKFTDPEEMMNSLVSKDTMFAHTFYPGLLPVEFKRQEKEMNFDCPDQNEFNTNEPIAPNLKALKITTPSIYEIKVERYPR